MFATSLSYDNEVVNLRFEQPRNDNKRTSKLINSENMKGIHSVDGVAVDQLASTNQPEHNVFIADDEVDDNEEPRPQERPSRFVIRVTAIAGLGGILFGYDLGVISGALPYLAKDFDLSDAQKEWVVSILYVGSLFGSILGGSMCDAFGRKKSILITDVLFVIGAMILFLAPSYSVVLQGRIVVGFAVAVSGIADVSYLHEISPVQWRGSIVSVNEACISLGFLLAFATGSLLSFGGDEGAWRVMFGLSSAIAILQFGSMLSLPESPIWLKKCGRHEECEAALNQINAGNTHDYDHHLQPSTERTHLSTEGSICGSSQSVIRPRNNTSAATTRTQQRQTYNALPPSSSGTATPAEEGGGSTVVTSDTPYTMSSDAPVAVPVTNTASRVMYYMQQVYLLSRQAISFLWTTSAIYPRQGLITVFLSVTQQLCGQVNILSFAPSILASLVGGDKGGASFVAGWTTVTIGLVKSVVTMLVIWKIDHIGRRPLLISGMSAISAGLVLLTVTGASIDSGDASDDSSNTNNSVTKAVQSNVYVAAMAGILLVVTGYSMSFGPLTWLLTSELFPTDIRGRALGASSIMSTLSAIFVTSTFLSMQSWVGNTALFGCYLLATMLGTVFAISAIPETKKLSVKEIDSALDRMMWWREHGRLASRQNRNGGGSSFDQAPTAPAAEHHAIA